MGTVIAIAAILAIVLAALLTGVWLVTRNPQRDRELRAERAENERLRGLLGQLRARAQAYADVNPVAQVFLDDITSAGYAPAPIGRK